MKSPDIPMPPYSWSSDWGEDKYGLWTEFRVKNAAQRMRWIRPGLFLMGSPLNEPERFDDEAQHEVELTKGFWLADTACTQALWVAVMENNPSDYKGPDRPEENISYQDCQKFLETVNHLIHHLELRLPTEAEWEYACRAETGTPFWFGETINSSQVNYNEAEHWMFWHETMEVKALPPNGWGLYQMHGNVREWCADWYGAYEAGRAVDPKGPPAGDARVLRGGSWFSRRRGCRSAARLSRLPEAREDNYGFRLCRDQ